MTENRILRSKIFSMSRATVWRMSIFLPHYDEWRVRGDCRRRQRAQAIPAGCRDNYLNRSSIGVTTTAAPSAALQPCDADSDGSNGDRQSPPFGRPATIPPAAAQPRPAGAGGPGLRVLPSAPRRNGRIIKPFGFLAYLLAAGSTVSIDVNERS